MELEMDCLTSKLNLQKAFNYKYQLYTKVCASSGLVSEVQVMAGQNIKKKYLMCQIPIRTLKQHAIPSSSLQNLKDLLMKRVQKQ